MASVVVYFHDSNRRSKIIAEAMYRGIQKLGDDRITLKDSRCYTHPNTDVAVFYGWGGGLRRTFDEYKAAGLKAVYIDLGFWGRRKRTKHDGYHKIVVNSRHPTEYFQNVKHSHGRFKHFGIDIKPWQQGGNKILLAGMSEKAAKAEGFRPEQWEKAAVDVVFRSTNKTIHYRPKPNWSRATRIRGTVHQGDLPLQAAFKDCHAVMTHHSNIAVDAILAGIPTFCESGVASVMSLQDLSKIDEPWYPEEREQWAADIAWTQFSVEEMATGFPWRHLKNEGLIP